MAGVSLTILIWSFQSPWTPGWHPGASIGYLAANLLIILIISTLLYIGSQAAWKAESLVSEIAESRFAIFLVAALGFCVAALLCWLTGIPSPEAHDEFSYLLGADTFAHGRLTNPTHPMWRFFETFHVIQQPTYASKYPPAQALFLAAGQLLGSPIEGAWIAAGLACGAMFWMLKQWMPVRWALLGTLLVSLHPLLVTWGNNYWGGSAAVIGGALLIGAARQIADSPKYTHGLIAGIAVSILVNSRPYEGLILTIVTAILTVFCARTRGRISLKDMVLRCAGPATAVLVLTAIAMLFYNYRVTGNPLKMPYQLYEATYNPVPVFLWQKLRPLPAYNHFEFRKIYEGDSVTYFYNEARSISGLFVLTTDRLRNYAYWFFLGPVPFLGLILASIVARTSKETRLIGLGVVVCCLALLLESWEQPHYLAPAAGLCLLFSLMVLRRLRALTWSGFPFGLLLTRTLAVVVLICFVNEFRLASRARPGSWHDYRARQIEALKRQGGAHLIIVHYSPDYEPEVEWVFNAADIDRSPVVWAHDMGDENNKDLIDYFKGRRVWLLNLGKESASLAAYPSQTSASRLP